MKNTDEDDDFDFSWAENFSKRMTKFGEKMAKFGEKMADMGSNTVFNNIGNIDEPIIQGNHVVGDIVYGNSVVTVNGKTLIKKNGKKIVIDKDGNVTINGKKTVTLDENCYNKTAAECNADKVYVKFPSNAGVHETLESDMEVISRGELNRVIHENDIKFTNIYWYIALGCLMVFGLTTWINCLICEYYLHNNL
jgi:hypothetical protein